MSSAGAECSGKPTACISIFTTVDAEHVDHGCPLAGEAGRGDSVGRSHSTRERATWDLRGFTLKRQELSEPLTLPLALRLPLQEHPSAAIPDMEAHRSRGYSHGPFSTSPCLSFQEMNTTRILSMSTQKRRSHTFLDSSSLQKIPGVPALKTSGLRFMELKILCRVLRLLIYEQD